MKNNEYPLSLEEFNSIYKRVPRLTVEIVVTNRNGDIYLTKRAIEPCIGLWHLPGGTVFFGESLIDAVQRVAKRELQIKVTDSEMEGYIEYPSHYKKNLDSPVGIVFKVNNFIGDVEPNTEALAGGWFSKIPKDMHPDQDTYLINHNHLKPM